MKSISIRELFLLVLIVALFLAWRSAAPVWRKLSQLQIETGHIRQESDKVIYVRQQDSERESQWRFKVLVPEGAKYQCVWRYELGNSEPLFLPSPSWCPEGLQTELLVFINHGGHLQSEEKEWVPIEYSGNAVPSGLFIDSSLVKQFELPVLEKEHSGPGVLWRSTNRSRFTDNFVATYDYDSGLYEFELGETILLLRLEGMAPDSSEDISIELNMVPMNDLEIKAYEERIGNLISGPFQMGGTGKK